VVHDLRNPIGAIKGVMFFIRTNTISEEDRNKLISMFSERLDTTLDIMNNLADWSKIQSADEKNQKETVHLRTFTTEMLHHFKVSAEMKNNRFSNLVDNELYMEADPGLLKFILQNMVANANKFTENGTITLYVLNERESVVFSVSDTGSGMSPEMIDKVLHQSGIRLSPGIKRENGSGLGLLLIKKLIGTLNGRMEIESREGKGTTVFLYFKK
jgi:signal transduction histidine kinase